MSEVFITHQPLVTKAGKIMANRLTLHAPGAGGSAQATAALQAIEEYWPMEQQAALFLHLEGCTPTPEFFDWMLPENAVLEFSGSHLAEADAPALVATIKSNAPNLCLDVDAHVAQAAGSGLTFRFVGFDARSLSPAQIQALTVKLRGLGAPLCFNVDTPQNFTALLQAGMNAAGGWFCKQPTGQPGKTLAPAQAQIIRVLNLVRNNADVPQIETALKQDVALSYKLLRYINSAGFGLSCEIQSFRHAVTILGYDKLHKWLSLLLVTASKDPLAPAQMHVALTRARLMELLGAGMVDKGELDNLFITGAFSLLDVLLGVSMEQALDAMSLPEPILDALLGRGGAYAPFFELALATEGDDPQRVAAAAQALGLDANRVNAALLQAMSFAATMAA